MARGHSLTLLPEPIAICRLEPAEPVPVWATASAWPRPRSAPVTRATLPVRSKAEALT